MIRIERDLRRLPHVAQVLHTRGGHYRLVLTNGNSTITSSALKFQTELSALSGKEKAPTVLARDWGKKD
jgi:hypothetical protein